MGGNEKEEEGTIDDWVVQPVEVVTQDNFISPDWVDHYDIN